MRTLSAVIVSSLLLTSPAWAYLGPGAGLSAFGSLLAVLLTVVVTFAAFLWYPLKRAIKAFRPSHADRSASGATPDEGDARASNPTLDRGDPETS